MTRFLLPLVLATSMVACAYPTSVVGDGSNDTGSITCYPDEDGDGYGNGNFPDVYPDREMCPPGTADNGRDQCDDNEWAWTTVGCDIDLDDADHDGYDFSEDCDDNDPDVHPGATEYCDGLDNDCDGTTDEGCDDGAPVDSDRDGYSTLVDCNDSDPDINPGADEECDGVDNDCDGWVDEACDGPDAHTLCVTARGSGVTEFDLGMLTESSTAHWVVDDDGQAVVDSPVLTEVDTDGCFTFVAEQAKINGFSPDSDLWGQFIVGVDNGSSSIAIESGGKASVLKLAVDGVTVPFCERSYDLCWNWRETLRRR